jgi:peroxiredoxin
VLGISVDSYAANKRFKEYGIFDEEGGYARRATFTVDKQGIIRHIEQGKEAIDPTGAYQSCSALGD